MKKLDSKFIQIEKDGEYSYGGSQTWWDDENESVAKYGCGVIAMCNLELCLDRENKCSDEKYIIEFTDYKNIVNKKYKEQYFFSDKPPFDSLGLMPWTMKKGLKNFCKSQGVSYKVKWAPTLRKGLALTYIRCMLKNNIPVTASYYAFNRKNKLNFYTYDYTRKTMIKKDGCRSHYFNITGMVELDEELGNTHYFIISSWGKKFYIRVDDWLAKLSYFSNVLFLEKPLPFL